jgi:selenocysteine-specific elongation factor
VVTIAELGGPSEFLDVMLEISPRATRPVKDGVRVRAHHGSGNVAAHVALAGRKELSPGSRGLAQLRLESPAFVFAGDRFTVRDWPEQHTLAGAVVLDPDGSRRTFRTTPRQQWLGRVAEALNDSRSMAAAYVARAGAARRSELLRKSHFSSADIAGAVDALAAEGVLVAAGDFVCAAGAWQALIDQAAAAIDTAQRLHPEHLGLPLADLRATLEPALPFPELFDPLIESLPASEFARAGAVIRRASHQPVLPQPLEASGAAVRKALAAKPLEPPSRKELAPDAASQRALRFLIDTGEVLEISADLVMPASSVAQATELIRTYIRDRGPATVSDLRQALGTSRRIVVPLLEYLDRTFVTLRQGDKRALRR